MWQSPRQRAEQNFSRRGWAMLGLTLIGVGIIIGLMYHLVVGMIVVLVGLAGIV